VLSLGAVGCGTEQPPDSCPETIDQCLSSGDCGGAPTTWQAAQDPHNWGYSFCDTSLSFVSLTACPSYEEAIVSHIDAGDDYYYDSEGRLLRVDHFTIGRTTCVAGDAARPSMTTAGCTYLGGGGLCPL